MPKPRKKPLFEITCSCGCGQVFMTNRKNKKYKDKAHKMNAWERTNHRGKIGPTTTMILNKQEYLLLPVAKARQLGLLK